ncbi:phosphotransferase [Crossiella sp. CA-258035]|uniref:phosphotransferase family protein n=1 Tax=Crossiella sp. CA-258035 TaxID=2981138 RepID=UPI0024BD390B|nr:phosphotransferase [Crossiella sp. CA-258035]WHT16273.1 phosphotransferase [Crossiella sp. CA-258035]
MPISARHREVLRRELPGADLDGLVVHQGQFHEVVLGADRVVCFARTAPAASRLPARAARLRSVAGMGLGFATPVPLSEVDGDPACLVLSRVPGDPLAAHRLTAPPVFEAVAAGFGALLRELAGVKTGFPSTGSWPEFAEGVRAELFPLMSGSGRARAEAELVAVGELPHWVTGLVHGDLGGENVLWYERDGLPRLSGVVDWDEAGLGDQAEDLAAIRASYGEEMARAVVAHLPPDEALLDRARVIGGTFALQQALAGLRDGDEEELADGLSGYR